MSGILFGIAVVICSLLWLGLLLITGFNLAVVGVGLLGGLLVVGNGPGGT